MLLDNYLYVAVFLILAIVFTVTTLLLPATLRRIPCIRIVRHNPNPVKSSTYECGMDTVGSSQIQFNFRYYFYAIAFVVIDILTVFLYPWAVNLMSVSGASPTTARLLSVAAIAGFIFIVSIGYIYAWRKGILEWK